MTSINDLPDEVLEFIMLDLAPYNDLKNCMLTCKRWSQLVRNVIYHIKMNMDRGLIEYRLCWKSKLPAQVATAGPTIAGRFSHSSVIHNNSMYVFGGGSSSATAFNDLWRFDLSRRQWVRPLSMGTYPSPKACATMVAYKDSLVLYGGWRQPSAYPPYQPWVLFDELHMYSIPEFRWTVYMPQKTPPRMASHSATVHGDKMIIFGGYHKLEAADTISNEVWCFDFLTLKWEKPMVVGANKPFPRYGQFQFAIDDTHLMILGGCGGPNSLFNDAWVLDMSIENAWTWESVTIKNKKWAATQMWCSPACVVGKKLIVLGPTPALPSDFQMVKQSAPPIGAASNRRHNPMQQQPQEPLLPGQRHRFDDNPGRNILPQQPNIVIAPAAGPPPPPPHLQRSLRASAAIAGPSNRIPANDINNLNPNEHEQRLQRNLQLRQRVADDPLIPRRFNEPQQDRLDMAAFYVNAPGSGNRQRQFDRLRQLERLRRGVEERISQMRRPEVKEKFAKRRKRDCVAMFVCDISDILGTISGEPTAEWQDYKNNGFIYGAPERLIFSSIVAGNGEMILFGGVHKECISTITATVTNVSNSLFFLTVPREVI